MAKKSAAAAFRDLSGPLSESERRRAKGFSGRPVPFKKGPCGFYIREVQRGHDTVLQMKDRATSQMVSCVVGEMSAAELCGKLRDKIREIPALHNPLPWKR